MAIPTERIEATVVEGRDILTPVGPRVRWGGVMSGLFVAIGTLMLLTALGLAIGITALGDPRAATGETASGLGIGAGIWAFITLLVSVFLGGMVSTQVTDSPDRAGAVIHAVLVWVLFLVVIIYLIVSGMSLGLTGLFGAAGALTRGATAAVGVGGISPSIWGWMIPIGFSNGWTTRVRPQLWRQLPVCRPKRRRRR